MEALTLEAFDGASAEFDAAVLATPGIDHFCSASDWIIPASAALMPTREPWIRRGDSGWAAFMSWRHPEGWQMLQPFEAMWGLACPLVGDDDQALVHELEAELHASANWSVLFIGGVPVASALGASVLDRFGRRWDARLGDETVRCLADLTGGAEAWLARRTPNFRRSLRRAIRDAEEAGLHFERCDPHDEGAARAAYERVLAVEARSWKGQDDSGLVGGEMQEFYRRMLPRLAQRGALRLSFARHEERDVGFIFGGLRGDTYRGLQFSFDDDYRALGLGNVAQWHEIRALGGEGVACYDLGTDREYKHRWADRLLATSSLFFIRA